MPERSRYTVLRKIAVRRHGRDLPRPQQFSVGFERPVVLKRIRPGLQRRLAVPRDAHRRSAHRMSLTTANSSRCSTWRGAGGFWFLVLELVDGWDLNQVMRRALAAGMPLGTAGAAHRRLRLPRLAYATPRRTRGVPLGNPCTATSARTNVLLSEQAR